MLSQEFEFKVGSYTYHSARMNAFEQFEVTRQLRNVLTSLAMIEDEVKKKKDKSANPTPHAFVRLMCAAAGGLTRSESNDSIALCLSKVERQQTGQQGIGWASIQVPTGNGEHSLMFADIELPQMLEIVWHVLKSNGLIDFFSVSPSNSDQTEPVDPKDGQNSQTRETGSSARPSRVSAGGNR